MLFLASLSLVFNLFTSNFIYAGFQSQYESPSCARILQNHRSAKSGDLLAEAGIKSGIYNKIPWKNASHNPEETSRFEASSRPYLEEYKKLMLNASGPWIKNISKRLEEEMARLGMTYAVTEPGGKKVLKVVPIQTGITYISREQYNSIVKATGDFFKFANDFLTSYLANPSDTESLVRQFKLNRLGKEKKDLLLSLIKRPASNSIFSGPEFKDYPIFGVVRADNIYNGENFERKAFEPNGMTPSGVSNFRALVDSIKKLFPEYYNRYINPFFRGTDFEAFDKVMTQNTRNWVRHNGEELPKDDKGLIVVIGPGSENGANPEIANIVSRSGMSQVRLKDCYVSTSDGLLHLNTGEDASTHPVIRGIYSRSEPSYLLADPRNGFGFENLSYDPKNPDHFQKLAIDQGLNPKIFLNINAEGKLEAASWAHDTLGRDPRDTRDNVDTLVDLIKSRKLYVSNALSRKLPHITDSDSGVVGQGEYDGKTLYRLLAQLAEINGHQTIAPPKSYSVTTKKEANKLAQKIRENPSNYVIKPPDKSSGEGVNVLAELSSEQQEAAIQEMLDNPAGFEVQEYTLGRPLIGYWDNPQTGRTEKVLLATDVGTFMLMASNGSSIDAIAPEGFFLARVATYGTAITNTAKGGGYYIVLVEPEGGAKAFDSNQLQGEIIFQPRVLGVTYQNVLRQYGKLVFELQAKSSPNVNTNSPEERIKNTLSSLKKFTSVHREVFWILGIHYGSLELDIHKIEAEASELKKQNVQLEYIARFLETKTQALFQQYYANLSNEGLQKIGNLAWNYLEAGLKDAQ